jgi:hypothetical protein
MTFDGALMQFIEWMDRSTDNVGKVMRTLIAIVLILFVCVYWTETSNFVSGHASKIGQTVSKWLVDNTPKK